MTVRLPYDLHREAAQRAHARRWNMSDYVAWCVEQAVFPGRRNMVPPMGAVIDLDTDPQESSHV